MTAGTTAKQVTLPGLSLSSDVAAWRRVAVAYSSSKGNGDTWKLLSRLAVARRRPAGLNAAWVTSSSYGRTAGW